MFQEVSWNEDKEQAALTSRLFCKPPSKLLTKGLNRPTKKLIPAATNSTSSSKLESFISLKKVNIKEKGARNKKREKSKRNGKVDKSNIQATLESTSNVTSHSNLDGIARERFSRVKDRPGAKTGLSRVELPCNQGSLIKKQKKTFDRKGNSFEIRKGSGLEEGTMSVRKGEKKRQDSRDVVTPSSRVEEPASKRQKTPTNLQVEEKETLQDNESDLVADRETDSEIAFTRSVLNTNTISKFQRKVQRKLEGGQFRWLNEKLYKSHSSSAQRLFKDSPQLFNVYHAGFTAQVKSWPTNPVDVIIDSIKTRSPTLVVADFGCGDAKIAQAVENKVHSFDLAAKNDFVTVCDMSNVPLEDASVDIGVFCLSLMGTNILDFISEAHRVLKMKGTLKIAEVASRIEDLDSFMKDIASCGFRLLSKDTTNKFFVSMDFEKSSSAFKKPRRLTALKPCIYKKR